MSKVLEGLWVCDWEDVKNVDFMKRIGTTHVLNCAENLSRAAGAGLTVEYHKLGLEDGWSEEEDPHALELFLEGAAILQKWFDRDSVIVVHCQAGMSRSPSVVIAWLILYRGLNFEDAHAIVKRARPFISPNPFYTEVLKGFGSGARKN